MAEAATTYRTRRNLRVQARQVPDARSWEELDEITNWAGGLGFRANWHSEYGFDGERSRFRNRVDVQACHRPAENGDWLVNSPVEFSVLTDAEFRTFFKDGVAPPQARGELADRIRALTWDVVHEHLDWDESHAVAERLTKKVLAALADQ
jgi:hypothetical protein